MTGKNSKERFHRELQRWTPPPAAANFYQGVWDRIRQEKSAAPPLHLSIFYDWLGGLCWKAVPICLVLVLIVSGWSFFIPYENPAEGNWEEMLVNDESETSIEEDLLQEVDWMLEPEARVRL